MKNEDIREFDCDIDIDATIAGNPIEMKESTRQYALSIEDLRVLKLFYLGLGSRQLRASNSDVRLVKYFTNLGESFTS